jgi:CubicO group peptidase (beta-lactamase class C family)
MAMASTESAGEDAVMLASSRFSAGFEKGAASRANLISPARPTLSASAFGFSGLGGSVGFADPSDRFSFGYAMNRHAAGGPALSARYQPLIDATYRSFGFRSCASGTWAK